MPKNKNLLLVIPKKKGTNVTKVKKSVLEKIDPSNMGIGVAMGKETRDGGIILRCGKKNREMMVLQHEIQGTLGDAFEVIKRRRKKILINI